MWSLLYLWKCSKNWPEFLPTNPTLYAVLNKLVFKYPLQRHFLVSTTSLQLPSQLHNIWHDSCILPLEAQLLKLKDGSKKSFFASCDFTTHSEFFKSAKKIIKLFMLAVGNLNVVSTSIELVLLCCDEPGQCKLSPSWCS